jgi:hypothetical protein
VRAVGDSPRGLLPNVKPTASRTRRLMGALVVDQPGHQGGLGVVDTREAANNPCRGPLPAAETCSLRDFRRLYRQGLELFLRVSSSSSSLMAPLPVALRDRERASDDDDLHQPLEEQLVFCR